MVCVVNILNMFVFYTTGFLKAYMWKPLRRRRWDSILLHLCFGARGFFQCFILVPKLYILFIIGIGNVSDSLKLVTCQWHKQQYPWKIFRTSANCFKKALEALKTWFDKIKWSLIVKKKLVVCTKRLLALIEINKYYPGIYVPAEGAFHPSQQGRWRRAETTRTAETGEGAGWFQVDFMLFTEGN